MAPFIAESQSFGLQYLVNFNEKSFSKTPLSVVISPSVWKLRRKIELGMGKKFYDKFSDSYISFSKRLQQVINVNGEYIALSFLIL